MICEAESGGKMMWISEKVTKGLAVDNKAIISADLRERVSQLVQHIPVIILQANVGGGSFQTINTPHCVYFQRAHITLILMQST